MQVTGNYSDTFGQAYSRVNTDIGKECQTIFMRLFHVNRREHR